MVPLAWALRAAGHDVRVAVAPALASTVARSGLPAVVVGRDVDVAGPHRRMYQDLVAAGPADGTSAASLREAERNFALFVRVADAMTGDLLRFARAWRPDLVVFDPYCYAGPLVARLLGVPAVRHLYGPDINSLSHQVEARVLAPVLARYGLAELDLLGQLTVDVCPPGMQVREIGAPLVRQRVRHIPYTGLSEIPPLPRWSPGRSPRVCLTWGTSTARLCGDDAFVPPWMLQTLAELGGEVRVAILAEQRALLPDPPPGVRIVESAPIDEVLRGCDLIVHQGGSGTALTAARRAVPQLTLPQLPCQMIYGDLLSAAGVARSLHRDRLGPATLTAAASEILAGPGYRRAARRLRAEMLAQPTPAEVVPALVDLARRGVAPADGQGRSQPAGSARDVFGMSYLEYARARGIQ
jgi:UDP:flavonoid glycosyltransferase YjiC (YdhE family)